MTITDEILSAYIDGELTKEEAEKVSTTLRRDETLAARHAQLKSADRMIAAAYSDIDNTPMPQAVIDLLNLKSSAQGHNNVVPFPLHRVTKVMEQWATPIAASLMLVVGLGLGMQITSTKDSQTNENILAAGVIDNTSAVHYALEKVASAQTYIVNAASGDAITPSLTFQTRDGAYCREFTATQDDISNRGVACRNNNAWEIQLAILVPTMQTHPETYATASVEVSIQFDEFVDSLIIDEPLGVDEEKALMANW